MRMGFDAQKTRRRIAILWLCWLFGGCSEGPAPTVSWEHSTFGLYGAAISYDGHFAVVSSTGGNASYWDLKANQMLYAWRHQDGDDNEISHIAFAPNNSHVITASVRDFVVWNARTGEALGYWGVDADINDIAISNAGRFVLLGLKDGRAIHINQRTRRRLEVVAHQNERVATVDMTADGTLAVTGGNDGRVVVWNSNTGSEIHEFEHLSRLIVTKFDPTQQRLLTADEQGHAYIWDLDSGDKLTTLHLDQHQRVITAVRFSDDGSRLLLGFPGRDLRLWDTSTGQRIGSWSTSNRAKGWVVQGSTVYAVAFNEQENAVLAESSNGRGGMWPITAGN